MESEIDLLYYQHYTWIDGKLEDVCTSLRHAWDIDTTALNHIDQVVDWAILPKENISIVNTVLACTSKLREACMLHGILPHWHDTKRASAYETLGNVLSTVFTVSRSSWPPCTVVLKLMPPFSFLRKVMLGGFLFSLHTQGPVRTKSYG